MTIQLKILFDINYFLNSFLYLIFNIEFFFFLIHMNNINISILKFNYTIN